MYTKYAVIENVTFHSKTKTIIYVQCRRLLFCSNRCRSAKPAFEPGILYSTVYACDRLAPPHLQTDIKKMLYFVRMHDIIRVFSD